MVTQQYTIMDADSFTTSHGPLREKPRCQYNCTLGRAWATNMATLRIPQGYNVTKLYELQKQRQQNQNKISENLVIQTNNKQK
jgi:hypothetical protein